MCHQSGVAKTDRLERQVCGVAKSNDELQDAGSGKKTNDDKALGGKSDKVGDLLGVCGADYRQAGSSKRESLEISSVDKDQD